MVCSFILNHTPPASASPVLPVKPGENPGDSHSNKFYYQPGMYPLPAEDNILNSDFF